MANAIFWEFTGETRRAFSVTLKQIRAVQDSAFASAGQLGGWISDTVELAQDGSAWVGRNADVWDGVIRGGSIEGGVIRGGTIEGGTVRGGAIWDGFIRGGDIRGGVILGGVIEGGIIWGGVIREGVIKGGDFLTISPIGSENGQFTATITDKGEIICNRGCWSGTLEEFEAAVAETHGENEHSKAYASVIDLVRMRLGPIAAGRARKCQEANQ